MWEGLVFNFNFLEGVCCLLFCYGRDRNDPIATMANDGISEHGLILKGWTE